MYVNVSNIRFRNERIASVVMMKLLIFIKKEFSVKKTEIYIIEIYRHNSIPSNLSLNNIPVSFQTPVD